MTKITKEDFTRVNSDVNGNPRYVIHFLQLTNKEDEESADKICDVSNSLYRTSILYNIAIKRAKKIGGRKWHNKQYGGGIIFQTYSLKETIAAIEGVLDEI